MFSLNRRLFKRLEMDSKLFEQRKFKPVVYRKIYNFESVPQGMSALASRETYGKVIVQVSSNSRSSINNSYKL